MKKILSKLVFLSIILFSLCCGKKGPIYPPLVNIPKPVEEFQVFQRGGNIILNWNNPTTYIDGSPLEEITRIDIWLLITSDAVADNEEDVQKEAEEAPEEEGEEERGDGVEKEKSVQKMEAAAPPAESFPENAKFVASISKELFSEYQNQTQEQSLVGGFLCLHPISPGDFSGKTYIFGLKVWAKKKESDFSPLLSIKPAALPNPPVGLKAEVLEDKIRIQWVSPEKNIDDSSPADIKGYFVYRKSEDKALSRLNPALISDTQFFDSAFQFDIAYSYYVRASANALSPFLESDNSESLEITPKDVFPPKMPRGLVAISGDDYVSLSWNPNRESDLAGYRILRKSSEDKDFTVLEDLIRENVYNDTSVKEDISYEYAITAVDKSGNESEKSKNVSAVPGRGMT